MKSMAKVKATCPNCGEKTSIGERPKTGQVVVCNNCGIELEIVSLDPLILDWVYDPEDIWQSMDEMHLADEEF
jgi:lysine biosynthesis protein LysW